MSSDALTNLDMNKLLLSCLLELSLAELEPGGVETPLPNGWSWLAPETYDYQREMEIIIENSEKGIRHFRRWRTSRGRERLLLLINELVAVANLK